jgi:cytochrome c oxidase assembly protein subunit 11
MLALAYASVPLYQMFCQATGFGGTTQRAAAPSATVLDKRITVRFDATVSPGLGWTFEPVERTQNLRIGETGLAYYRATNTSARAVTGTATYNVTPDQAGIYFNKLECFCFTEQTLQPGQSIDMPVSYFVDPAIVKDAVAGGLDRITLSYTFYSVAKPGKSVTENATAQPPRKGS